MLDRTRGRPDSRRSSDTVATWPVLPQAIRAGILAMVRTASGKNGWS